MSADLLAAITSAAGSAAVAITALALNHRGFADLRSEINHRFDAINTRFDDLNRYLELRFSVLEDRVRRLEERLEHPVIR